MDLIPRPPEAPVVLDPQRYQPPLPVPTRRGIVLAIGFASAVLLYCTARALGKSYSEAFFCSPFFVGAIIGVLGPRRPIRNSLYTVLAALALGIVTLHEGVICVLFALPLVVPETILGALCGATIRRYVHDRRHRVGVAALLVMSSIGWQAIDGALDDPAHHPLHHVQSTTLIAAPPERVFAALTARPIVVAPRWPWFISIGLPVPTRFTVDTPGPNGRVRAVFSHGVANGHITEWVPGRVLAYQIDTYAIDDLAFHITRLGRGPNYGLRPERVDDWLTLTDTRYRLEPAPGGGTRLTRDTSWRRHLAPAFYFGWLQDTIMRRGQDRLLELLRQRIDESEPWEGSEPPAMSFSGQSPPSLTRSTGAAVDPGPAVAAVPAARL
ncbi:MAG TPA: SRPBCC family protein [Polyangia bacterium]|jgi:uncharacterized protein YndB with AHSA1/START domain|nr:SRPBCC family protein [Polyangia bacterium]